MKNPVLMNVYRVLASLALFWISQSVWGQSCLPPLGNGNVCTAKDVVTTSEVLSGPSACTAGETISLALRIEFSPSGSGGSIERYDAGLFVGDFGGSPIDGDSCTFASLSPIEPPLDLLSGTGPYRDLDGDICGDIRRDETTYRDVQVDTVLCRDSNGDGRLDFNYAVAWSVNRQQDVCTNPADPANFVPDQSSQCRLEEQVDLDVIVEPAPSIAVTKFPTPSVLPEPGGDVTFTVAVTNTSSATDPVTITSLDDDVYGDLDGQGDCTVPQTLQPGETYVCSFVGPVSGSAGESETDTVTAAGSDDENEPVSASAQATVSIQDAPPPQEGAIRVAKIAAPRELPEPGGDVSFTVVVANVSGVEVTLESLSDDVYGDLDGQGDCSVPQTLPSPGFYSCQFTAAVQGAPGDEHIDTVTASGTDTSDNPVSDDDSASVIIADVPSSIRVTKSATPNVVREPGGNVTFEVVVQNTSPVDTVTIEMLTDNVHGDLDGQGDCVLPQTLQPAGAPYSCRFTAEVSGNAGSFEVDTVTATGTDDDGQSVSGRGGAFVAILALAPSIEVVKIPTPRVLQTPGGEVTFTVAVQNTSSTSDTVTIETLEDTIHGDLAGQGDCAVPQILAPGETYLCSFTVTIQGDAGDSETNLVTAIGVDDEGEAVSAFAQATVAIRDVPPAPPPPVGAIRVVKIASPGVVPDPGGEVTFTVLVVNVSGVDVTLQSLVDDVYGDLDGQGDCSVPRALPAPGFYLCRFTVPVQGQAGEVVTDIVTAMGVDEFGNELNAFDGASVTIVSDTLVQPAVDIPALSIWSMIVMLLGFMTVLARGITRRGR